ncbi:MTH1187 family thiamine-binding protein [Paenibacillus sp. MWE-103]|uniref:MTH1187 family thiamine-binding protein n=1 Tax=Paenibacillus artemisiicola TaxID=1172618 RepID=A0ABS3W2X7_9BACL|nr:MTH1187 family thiamine-binding protein [Paenibacillus artemisiicola]MBO7742652.1 MTH1187 family thiamine-binding protein [Paenibacillus artemisiicola]
MAIVQVTVVPLGTETPSLGAYVASVVRVLQEAKEPITYQLTPMSTIIEGELDDLLAVVRRMHEAPFGSGAARVSTSVTIDDRRDKKGTMAQKLHSVEEKLK